MDDFFKEKPLVWPKPDKSTQDIFSQDHFEKYESEKLGYFKKLFVNGWPKRNSASLDALSIEDIRRCGEKKLKDHKMTFDSRWPHNATTGVSQIRAATITSDQNVDWSRMNERLELAGRRAGGMLMEESKKEPSIEERYKDDKRLGMF